MINASNSFSLTTRRRQLNIQGSENAVWFIQAFHSFLLPQPSCILLVLYFFHMVITIPPPNRHLPAGVSTVDDQIRTGGVGACVADQVHVRALELVGQAVAAHGDHVVPQGLGLLVDKVAQAGVDVARRDAVDARKVAPLVGQRPRHVNAAGLGDVVRGLLLGEVGDVTRHGGGDDQRAVALLLEHGAHGLGAVCRAVEIRVDHTVPILLRSVDDA